MKLVVVHDFADPALGAGATRCAIDTATIFARAGVDVVFAAASGEPALELAEAGVETHSFGQGDILRSSGRGVASVQGLWNSEARRRVASLVDGADLKSTIFHVHTWSKALSPSVLRSLTGPGVRSIFHLHEYFAACPNGGFFEYPKLKVCTRRPLGASCLTTNCDSRSPAHKAWRVARHLAMTYGAGYPVRGRNFILLSELQRRVLSPYLPQGSAQHLLRNPIEVEKQPRLPLSSTAKFLFAGRVSKEKGIESLAGAFASRQDQLIVAGAGPDLDWLKSMLPGSEFRGWQTSGQVKQAMREARALVFPSLWYEGMPMVVLEALANGAPVIASDRSSATEVLRDGETGIVFGGGDVRALTAALDRMGDDNLAERMSTAAYDRYWANPCDRERFRTEMETVFTSMLSTAA